MPQSRAVRPLLLVAALVAGAIHASGARADTASDPVPVLPGDTILSPGPRALGFKHGLAADPSTIGNFRGLVALTYLRGRVRDATGRQWVMANDMRLFQGDYVSADGIQRQGTFAFV
jgi:hypothetical protein